MPTVYQSSGDAIAEVSLAQKPVTPARANHLLLTPSYRLALGAASKIGFSGSAFLPLQIINALCGGLCAASFFLLAVRLGAAVGVSAFGSLFMAFSYAPWYHSREAESAIVSQCFLMFSLLLLATATSSNGSLRWWLTGSAAISFAASVLYALNAVLLLPALVLFGLLLARPVDKLRTAVTFTASFLICTVSILFCASQDSVQQWSIGGWIDWLAHHESSAGLPEVGSLSLGNLLRAASGVINYFVGDTAVTTNAKHLIQNREFLAVSPLEWCRFGLGVVVLLALLMQGLYGLRGRWTHASTWLATLGLSIHGLFNCVWLGSDPQFWLPIVPLLILLGLMQCPATSISVRSWSWTVGLAAVVTVNLAYPVPTLLMPDGGSEWKRAEAFAQQIASEDLVIHSEGWARYLPALGRRRPLNLVYSVKGREAAYLRDLDKSIDEVLQFKGAVFAVDVFELGSPISVGQWEVVEVLSGLERAEVVEHLTARYRVTPFGIDGVWRIEARRATGTHQNTAMPSD